MSYTNNDYGKGLANSIQKNFEVIGNHYFRIARMAKVTMEPVVLATGGDVLIVAGYLDQGKVSSNIY